MSVECCDSFIRMDVRGKTIPDSWSFHSAAPAVWNSLPSNIWSCETHNIPPTSKILSFPLSLCHCLVTHLSVSDSFSTMTLYKSIYLLALFISVHNHFVFECFPIHHNASSDTLAENKMMSPIRFIRFQSTTSTKWQMWPKWMNVN